MARIVARAASAALGLALVAATVFILAGPYRVYVVRTGSMAPTIPPASAVVVDPGRPFHPGDVITFAQQGDVTTHRFLGRNPDGSLITKGDANRSVDQWKLTAANVKGIVVAAPQHIGWAIIFLRQPTGLISAVLALTLVWLAWDICRFDARRQT